MHVYVLTGCLLITVFFRFDCKCITGLFLATKATTNDTVSKKMGHLFQE